MIEQLGSVVRTPQAPRLTVGTTDVPRTDFSAVIASLEPKRGADSDGTGTHDAESEASQTETSGRSTNTEADPHRTEEPDLPDDKTPFTHRPGSDHRRIVGGRDRCDLSAYTGALRQSKHDTAGCGRSGRSGRHVFRPVGRARRADIGGVCRTGPCIENAPTGVT